MSQADGLESFAVESYRYLRLSIVVVVSSMLASLLIERVRNGCFEESISAYYYTPAHAVFVGGLVAIGVTLIAIKGSTDWEDVLLNLSGVLAPIVAFVPTKFPGTLCSPAEYTIVHPDRFTQTNVLAYAIGGAVALALAFVIARLIGDQKLAGRQSLLVLGAGAAMLVIGLVWYFGFRENFDDHAHMGAAVAMFGFMGVAIGLSSYRRWRKGKTWRLYAAIVVAMGAGAGILKLVEVLADDWRHFILWLELVELGAFGLFWVWQTFEHWNGGVPTGVERELTASIT